MNVLTEAEAFAAMAIFLDRYFERAGDSLPTLLGDLTVLPDGGPLDAAAWDDWLDAVAAVRAGIKPPTVEAEPSED